ncbi:GCG_CRPN prefix-to-repeats domain-containing protein [Mesorhizobium sp. LjRoot246]|uniref:GCG_CRPN prefix-to-repeats domain-containing protein n=1 Tax=Mesorhizobium sp. LjRoot246 TaxID=3342294 RepID=UPI003ED0F5A3
MSRLKNYAAAAILAVSGTVVTATASNAMPIVSVAQPATLVENVRWGCGIGWHPNRWGRCVPNGVVIVRPRYHYWHAPAYGWHPHHHWRRWHRY